MAGLGRTARSTLPVVRHQRQVQNKAVRCRPRGQIARDQICPIRDDKHDRLRQKPMQSPRLKQRVTLWVKDARQSKAKGGGGVAT